MGGPCLFSGIFLPIYSSLVIAIFSRSYLSATIIVFFLSRDHDGCRTVAPEKSLGRKCWLPLSKRSGDSFLRVAIGGSGTWLMDELIPQTSTLLPHMYIPHVPVINYHLSNVRNSDKSSSSTKFWGILFFIDWCGLFFYFRCFARAIKVFLFHVMFVDRWALPYYLQRFKQ